MTTERIDRIHQILQQTFNPSKLEITDDSHLHAGHVGARSGKGHFTVLINSKSFEGKSPVQCHRMVYAALDELLQTDIHALSIKLNTPD